MSAHDLAPFLAVAAALAIGTALILAGPHLLGRAPLGWIVVVLGMLGAWWGVDIVWGES